MKTSRCSALLIILIVVSCRYPNEFKNTQGNARYAVLRGTNYPKTGHVFATQINGQPTSFWRNSDVFRIPAGTNTCAIAYSHGQETLGYQAVQFVATAGRDYVIARKKEPGFASPFTAIPHPTTTNAWIVYDRRDRVTISEAASGASNAVVADAPKEEYVFGFASGDSAIAAYRKKNP